MDDSRWHVFFITSKFPQEDKKDDNIDHPLELVGFNAAVGNHVIICLLI